MRVCLCVCVGVCGVCLCVDGASSEDASLGFVRSCGSVWNKLPRLSRNRCRRSLTCVQCSGTVAVKPASRVSPALPHSVLAAAAACRDRRIKRTFNLQSPKLHDQSGSPVGPNEIRSNAHPSKVKGIVGTNWNDSIPFKVPTIGDRSHYGD